MVCSSLPSESSAIPEHPLNAYSPIEITLSGIISSDKFTQFSNAFSGMRVTGFPLYFEGITILSFDVYDSHSNELIDTIKYEISIDSNLKVTYKEIN